MGLLRCDRLERHKELMHAFTDRLGGVSHAPYQENNLAFHVGDDPVDVRANHRALTEMLGIETLVHMRQVHSDRIVQIGPDDAVDVPPECDALITDVPGVALMVMSADCTPVLMYDPLRRAIAAMHAGRAGAMLDLAGSTLNAMHEAFGSRSEAIDVVLGPSVCAKCYTVNADIAQACEARGYGFALSREEGSIRLDINAILRRQLESRGARVRTLPHCTACEKERFFSYRAENGVTGRQAGVIMLRR